MKTKLGASLIAALMMMGLFGAVTASADPGPHHGNNKQGLCTAYFNGQKNGHNKDGKDAPPPFLALEEAADEADGEDGANSGSGSFETAADVFAFCDGFVGGNPTNGRFDCSGSGDDVTCEDGGGPGADGKGPEA